MEQDWIWGLIGGLLIGSGGAVYLLFNGRIMGASGIGGSLVDGSAGGLKWERLVFLAGVVLLPVLLMPAYGTVDTHITKCHGIHFKMDHENISIMDFFNMSTKIKKRSCNNFYVITNIKSCS